MNNIVLYGAARCHKTQHYINFLEKKNLIFDFHDVEKDEAAAQKLRSLYFSGKLNFPTIIVDGKKMRNPRDSELEKRIEKLS